jgi:hypothetical protein
MKTKKPMRDVARRAAEWPTIQQAADDYATTYRVLRQAVERGEIEAIRLNRIRVNPSSIEAWIADRYMPGE